MVDFGKYRYNMFQEKGHWFPGCFATDEAIAKLDRSRIPEGIPLEEMLRETHQALYVEKKDS